MKKLLILIALILAFASSANATDVTVGSTTIANFNPSGVGSDRTYTVTTSSSTSVTCSACLPSVTVGLGGFQVLIGSQQYTVATVVSTSSMTLTSATAVSGSQSMTFYKYVLLRIYADRAFQPAGASYIVQPGVPGSQAWYKQVAASIINNGSTNSLWIPSLTIDATTDATGPTNQARYTWAFYRPDGSLVQIYGCFEQMAVPPTTPTTHTALCAYNAPPAIVPPANEAYTKTQIDARFPSCTSGQMLYYAATGNIQACLTVGSGLSIAGGTITASGGGGGGSVGPGTVGYLPKFATTTTINNSIAQQISGTPNYISVTGGINASSSMSIGGVAPSAKIPLNISITQSSGTGPFYGIYNSLAVSGFGSNSETFVGAFNSLNIGGGGGYSGTTYAGWNTLSTGASIDTGAALKLTTAIGSDTGSNGIQGLTVGGSYTGGTHTGSYSGIYIAPPAFSGGTTVQSGSGLLIGSPSNLTDYNSDYFSIRAIGGSVQFTKNFSSDYFGLDAGMPLRFYNPGVTKYAEFLLNGSPGANYTYYLPTSTPSLSKVLQVAGVSGTNITLDWASGGSSSNIRQALNIVSDYGCDPTGVTAADTCFGNALTAAALSDGKIVYAPAGTYLLNATATIPGGVTVVGDGRNKTLFSGTVTSAPIFNVVQGSGSYVFQGPTLRDLRVVGNGGSGQIGINVDDATYVYGVEITNVDITGTGSHGLYIGNAFSSRFININSGSSTTGYPFYMYSDEMPGNYFESLYAGDVNATSPAGFRIQRGRVHCVSCNGINNSSANSWWAIVGDKVGVDGSIAARSAYFQCTRCNVESSRAGGILSYSNSPIDLLGQTTFEGSGLGSGSYKAISYDIDLALNPYPAFTSTGIISPTVVFVNTPITYYSNDQPIHSTDIPPLIVEGNGPQIAGQNGYGATFYNSTTARVEKLRRADAAAPFTTITTTTAFTQPGPRYFETNCAANCTLTLPWAGWYPNGEYVTVRNLSADGIVVTLASGGGGSVNGGTLAISKQGQGYTLYANNAASDWRIVADRSYLPNTYVAVGDTNMSVDGSSALTWDTTTLTLTKAGSNPSVQVVDSTNSITTRFGPLAGAPDRGIVGTSTNHPFVFYQNGGEAWGIDTSKHLRPYATANTLDLGTSTVPARTGYFGTSLDIGVSSTTTGSITVRNATNANTFTLQPGVTGANLTYTLPTAYSTGTQCLADNGSGTLSWTACSGGSSTPGGSNTQVQFNDSSNFNGDSGLTYNKTTNVLSTDHAIITQTDTTIVPLIVQAVAASTAELLQIKDSAGNVRGGYATSGAGFYRGFSSAPTAALANDGKLFYDITGGVTTQQLVLSKNTGQYNPVIVANQASYTANKIPLWSSTSWELENSMMTQGSGAVSLTIAPTASTSGSPTILTLTGPAHTALAADTEATDVNLNLNRNVQFTGGGGTFSLQRAMRFQSPTYRATGAETIGTAVLLYLDTPKAGTNMTLTSSYALGIAPSALGHHGLYFDFQTSATGNFIEFNSSGSSFGKIVSRTDRANYVFGGHTTSTADTDGFVYIPSVAGVPVGTPTAYTGTAPLTLDSTNNRLYGYMGGAWRNLTGAGGGTPGGSTTQLQYNNAGAFGGITGATTNGTFVTLTTPVLGVASATSINKVALTAPATGSTLTIADGKTLTASNTLTFTGTDASSVAFGTGGTVAYTANNLSVFAATTSAQLAGVLSDETGSGLAVFATSPTLTTPTLGVATATSINKVALTAPLTGSTITIADGKTLTASNTLTLTGTDASSIAFGTGGTVAYTANNLSVFAATTSAQLAGVLSDETGSGLAVFATSPTLTTPTIGSFANATHTHTNAAGGGQLTDAALSAAVTVAKGGTGITTGTSGGIPYFSSTSTIASSAALTANAPVIGGGAGVAPTVGTRSGNTTTFVTATGTLTSGNCAQWDANGNIVQASGACGVAGSGYGTIQEEGSNLTARATLNFVGSSATAADDAGNSRTNVTFDSDLNALASNASTGLWAVTGVGSGSVRTITGTTNVITVTNGDGVAGNPTLTVGSLVVRTDQANSFSTGSQSFLNASALIVPNSAGATPTADGQIAYDTTSNTLEFGSATNNRIIATTSNNLSAFANTTSAQLAGIITDETGTGVLVFATSPSLTTPSLGVATATSINKVALTAPATGSTLTIADGKTLTASNTLTFTGTDASSVAFGTGGTVAYTANNLSVFAATTSAQLAGVLSDETGSGVAVFGTSPAITTSLTTGSASFDLLNTTATTINFGGAATTISMGATGAAIKLGGGVAAAELRFLEPSGSGVNYIAFKAPALAADLTYTWPTAFGSAGQCLSDGGSGTLSWVTCSGGSGITSLNALTAGTQTFAKVDDTNVTLAIGSATSTHTFTVGWTGTLAKARQNAATVYNDAANTWSTGAQDFGAATSLKVPTSAGAAPTASGLIAYDSTSDTLEFGANTVNRTITTTSNNLSVFAATTSAQLAGVLSDETGTGLAVFATSPTLTTPVLGVATATSINKVALTAPATSATLTIADGKTLTASNTLTFTGTDSSSVAFGTGGTVAYTANNLSVFAATTSAQLAGVLSDETGSGVAVFGTSPSITTSLTTGSASFDLLNTTATTINFGGAATALNMAGGSGSAVKLGGGVAAAELRFAEPSGSGTEYIAFKAPALAASLTFTLPTTDSTGSQCLASNGSGTLSWSACSGGGGTPGGSNKQLQFNNSSAFGGATGFEYQSGASPNVSIAAQNVAYTPLNVNGLTSQTAPIQTWQLNGSTRTVIGEDARSIYIGNGRTSGTGTTGVVSGTEATGTNIGGSGLLLQGGAGTGSGTGGSVMFKTAPAGGSGASLNAYVTAMEIDSKSNIELGSGLNGTTSTEGFVYIQSVAGLPTGVPGTSYSGTVPTVIDSTNKGFCMYVSGWNCVRPTGGTTTQLLYNNGGYAAGIAGAGSNGTTVTFASASLLATSPAITTSLTTPSTTFALVNTTATTVNFAGAATTLNIGASAATVLNFGGSGTAAEFRFLEPSSGGSQYSAFKAGSQGSNITYTLPTTVAAVDGDVLSSNTSGTLSWITPTPATPPGTIVAYGGSTAPTGWLLCDGSAVTRTGANTALFAIVGTSYGTGDGSSTFNLPDLRQRFAMGKAASGTGATLGNTGGSIDHTHTSAAHTHASGTLVTGGPSSTVNAANTPDGFPGSENHTHTISGSTASTTPGATGSNNPPYVVVNYIIKQ